MKLFENIVKAVILSLSVFAFTGNSILSQSQYPVNLLEQKGNFSAGAIIQFIFLNLFNFSFPLAIIPLFGSTQVTDNSKLVFSKNNFPMSPVPQATSIKLFLDDGFII